MVPNSLADYRHRLADAAGFSIQTLTTAGANQANQIVVSDFLSSELEDTFLGNSWEYQPTGPNAGQVRRVQYHGLDQSTGTVTLERAHTTITPTGTPVEFLGKLPPVRYEGRLGLNDLVNKVLSECWTIQKLNLPAVLNQRVYPVGTLYPWLAAEDQVVEVYYRSSGQQPTDDDLLMINWRWVSGGDNPGIEIAQTLNTGDTLLPQVFVPMSWWLDTGTGFSFATSEGLSKETDRAVLPLLGMEIVGAPWLYLELSKWGLPDDQTTFRQLRAQSRAAANEWKRLTLEHPKVRKQHWPSVLTVRSRENFGYGYPVFSG
jgi:hypothetical protein